MRLGKNILFAFWCSIFAFASSATDLSWSTLQKTKEGTITIYYRSTEPFLIKEKNGALKGLEYEMMVGFKYFLWNKYGIRLHLEWESQESFKYVFGLIRDNPKAGDFGLDIISRTEAREKEVGFSNPYFPDIQVLVSDKTIPTTITVEEFRQNFGQYTAVSVAGTTYDHYLQRIKENYGLNFNIIYKESTNDIVSGILEEPGRFGYMDLPNYLIALNHNMEIKRQPILPVKGVGFCVIFKKGSDWQAPINEYLTSPDYEILRSKGIQKYLGQDVYDLIESISEGQNEDLVLLLKEKELVDKELSARAEQIERQSYYTNMLIASVAVALILAFALYNRNRVKSKANAILNTHRQMIENQNELLSKRNDELLELDEEKNNFIHILSHDLRAPINNIIGLAGLLQMDDNLSEDQSRSISHITSESRRLNKMITRILDVERIEQQSTDDFRAIDLGIVLENVTKNYELQAKEKGIVVMLEASKGKMAMGLDQYFFHVFENLLSNAIKFSPLEHSIHVKLESKEDEHWISIADEGPGMTEADKKNMFKKFRMLSAKPTGGERSTGLGLSIVHKYTELLGGTLVCESELGKGTTFIVKLKKASDQQPAEG